MPEANDTTTIFTPGPWDIVRPNGLPINRLRDPNGHLDVGIIATLVDQVGTPTVILAEAFGRVGEDIYLDAAANARLIAAAPDLLEDAKRTDEALTWLAEQMNSITDNARFWNPAQLQGVAQDLRISIESNQKRIRAAIAKAEGR